MTNNLDFFSRARQTDVKSNNRRGVIFCSLSQLFSQPHGVSICSWGYLQYLSFSVFQHLISVSQLFSVSAFDFSISAFQCLSILISERLDERFFFRKNFVLRQVRNFGVGVV